MGILQFVCPTTHQQAPTGIETNVQSLRACWKATVKVNCPHCGQAHEISVRETYLDAVLLDIVDIPSSSTPAVSARRH